MSDAVYNSPVDPWHVEQPDVTLAARFLRGCGRSALPPAQADQLRTLGMRLTLSDWNGVLGAAAADGMASLVFTHAARTGLLATMPPSVANALGASYRHTLVNNRRIQRLQESILVELREQGIEVIPIKGVILAVRHYGEVALRPTRDIDLFIRRADTRKAGEVLRRRGYRPEQGLTRPHDFLALELATLSYAREDSPTVEVHWELPHRPAYRAGLAPTAVLARSQIVDVAGRPTRCLDVADELRYLCVHCTADHRVGRLIWLVDIAQLIRALPLDWDWPQFIQETAAGGLATPVAVALAHCQSWLDLELPPDTFHALVAAASRPEDRWSWATAHEDERRPHGDLFSPGGLRAHWCALGSVADRLVFLSGLFVVRRWRIRELYGRQNARWRALPLAYVRHWWRMALYLRRALRR